MQQKKPKSYYLFGAFLAFALSAYALARMAGGKPGYISPGSGLFLGFAIGVVFLLFYFKDR